MCLYLAIPTVAQNQSTARLERMMADVELRFRIAEQERLASEEVRQQQFLRRVTDFVDLWNEFAAEYNQGVFNARKAKELSEAFHKIERTGQWPIPAEQMASKPHPRKRAR
jgi:hypothetical protein